MARGGKDGRGKSRENNLWGVAAILFRSAAGCALFLQREMNGCWVREKKMGLRCRGEKFKPGGRLFGLKIGLGLGFFLCFFSFKIAPLLCKCWKPVFVGKNVVRFPNLVPQLLSFCKFDFA